MIPLFPGMLPEGEVGTASTEVVQIVSVAVACELDAVLVTVSFRPGTTIDDDEYIVPVAANHTVFVRVATTVMVVVAVMGNFRSSIKRACSRARPQARDPQDLASEDGNTELIAKRVRGSETSMMSNPVEIEVSNRYYEWASSRMCGDVQRPRSNECLSKKEKPAVCTERNNMRGFLIEMNRTSSCSDYTYNEGIRDGATGMPISTSHPVPRSWMTFYSRHLCRKEKSVRIGTRTLISDSCPPEAEAFASGNLTPRFRIHALSCLTTFSNICRRLN
jgi:hypothetical protein